MLAALTCTAAAQVSFELKHDIPPAFGTPQSQTRLGYSVAVDGGYTVVGAPFDSLGELYSGVVKVFDSNSGALLHTILNPTPASPDQFGRSVAISGTRVLVGSVYVGSVYVYDLGGATPTVPVETIPNPVSPTYVNFGDIVAISGARAVVNGNGNIYVYDLSSNTPTVPVITLSNPDPGASNGFPYSLALSGTLVVAGVFGDDTGAVDAGCAYVYDLSSNTPTVPTTKLNNPDPTANDSFGYQVAISGTRVVVLAPGDDTLATDAGSVYVFDVAIGAPNLPVATLNDPNPVTFGGYEYTIAISGTHAVVGNRTDSTGAQYAGIAYVYDLTNAIPGTPIYTLNNPLPKQNGAFGASVAISGTKVAVGAPHFGLDEKEDGSAYVYDTSSGTPTTPAATLNARSPGEEDTFGNSVALSGRWMVVGAPHAWDIIPEYAGHAYVYDLSSATPTVPLVELSNPNPEAGDHFGFSVAISGSRVVVGAFRNNTGATESGTAYVYDMMSATPSEPIATLNNPSPAEYDHFGFAVAISGTRVVVGSRLDDTGGEDAGSAYVYDMNSGTPTVPMTTLNNPSPAEVDQFGWSVAISGARVVIGSSSGSAYIYDLSSGTPTAPLVTLDNPPPATGDAFGWAVAISGTRVVVGAHGDDTGANSAGSAYVYDLDSATPTAPVATLNNPNPAVGDSFGFSVSVSGNWIAVGAIYDDTGADSAGSTYIYNLGSGTPTVPVATINNPRPSVADNFARSVSIDGTKVAIGAPLDDTVILDKGYAYVFAPQDATSPVLSLPANITVEATSALGATVTYTSSASDAQSGIESSSFLPASGSTFPIGTTTVNASATDNSGNTATGLFSVTVVDTMEPTITGTFAPVVTVEGRLLADYKGQVETSDLVGVTSVTQSPAAGTVTSVGPLTVTLTAGDAAGNTADISFTLDVLPLSALNVVNTVAIAQGAAAPRAGTNGLPADAVLASFGIPAIDDAGNVAFVAKWSGSGGKAKGTGLFLGNRCLAIVGGDAAAILAGAKWASFSDPVIEGGKVACIAKLSTGVTAVVCNFTGAVLEKIALSGEAAADAGDAKFKSFKSVALRGGTVGFHAQLTGGTLADKVTAKNDSGMWIRDTGGVLHLVYRDGFTVGGGQVVSSFVSFVPSSGSAGQGRGWLSENNGGLVLSLNTFGDKTKGILFGGFGGDTKLARTGDVGTNFAPALAGASFAGFRYPAMNDALESAFFATLKVGLGGVTKADAGGIFAGSADFNGSLAPYELIAQIGKPAGATGTTFSTLGDPVLSQDGGIAFNAKLKATKTVKGTETIWWQPPSEPLRLLAQSGAATVGDIAGAEWKTFTNLAIAGGGRGPIFAATLVPKRGGVTASTASGVWATDFEDNTRLLFRTGDTINGKTLKSFTLLKATVGNAGVTRSFNDAAQVVWLATFTDKSTAIITTEVP